MKKKINIVTPVFNGYPLIRDTVESILQQKNSELFTVEYIVVDGGSDDGTLEYLDEQKKCFKSAGYTFQIISGADAGMYDALRKGFMALSDGDVYCYINAGDYFSLDCFALLDKAFDLNVPWITGLNVFYNRPGRICDINHPLDYDRQLIEQGYYGTVLPFIQQETTFWNGELQRQIDLDMLSKFKYAGDYYLWHTFSKHESLTVVKEWLGGFRRHDGQMSAVHLSKYHDEFNKIRGARGAASFLKAHWLAFVDKLPSKLTRAYRQKSIELN